MDILIKVNYFHTYNGFLNSNEFMDHLYMNKQPISFNGYRPEDQHYISERSIKNIFY